MKVLVAAVALAALAAVSVTGCAHGGQPKRAAVVAPPHRHGDVMAALRDRGVERVDVTAIHELLFDEGAVAAHLGRPLPFSLSPPAAQAWADGAAACLARGGRAPPVRNEIVRACAQELGAAVWEIHVASLGVDAVVEVRPRDAVAYAPGATVLRDVPYANAAPAGEVLDQLFATQTRPRPPAPGLPTAPAPDDALLRGAFTTFAANPNIGCGQALPATITVEGDTSFARALEAAWQALPARPRTAPAATCRANASSWKLASGAVGAGGWLDCAPALLPVGAQLREPTAPGATARLAELLVDRAVTETCTYEH